MKAETMLQVELKIAMLIDCKEKILFSFCDDFNASVAGMFPDSAIARKYYYNNNVT